MEIFNNIFWITGITGIWFFVWVVMYLLCEMFIDIFYLKPEKVKNIKKYTILLTIVILIFYIIQIIDYLNIFN